MTDDEKKKAEELAAEEAAKAAAEKEKAEKEKAEKDKKARFTPEQTEFINNLYNRAFAEGTVKAEAELAKRLEEEKKEREALAAQIAELKKAREEKKEEPKTNPELDLFKAQLDEVRGVLGTIKEERDTLKKQVDAQKAESRKSRKKDAFLEAAKEANVTFFDPLEAYTLAERIGYEWDDETDRPVVINKDTKRPKLNDNGEPMSVLDFVKDFAEKKKYLIKAEAVGGTGSSEDRKADTKGKKDDITVDAIESMSNEDFDSFVQKILNKR